MRPLYQHGDMAHAVIVYTEIIYTDIFRRQKKQFFIQFNSIIRVRAKRGNAKAQKRAF